MSERDDLPSQEQLIVKHPWEEFEDYTQIQVKILSRFQNEEDIDLHLEALELGKQLLKDES